MISVPLRPPISAYSGHMLPKIMRLIPGLVSGLPLILMPALAASGMTVGQDINLAWFLFSVAGAIVLTLILRRSVARLAGRLAVLAGRFRMRRTLDAFSAHVAADLIVPGAYGGLAKLDHVVVTPTGVLCIRSIHRSGMVFGDTDEAQWTNVTHGTRQRFLNPMIQNEGRRRALAKALPDIPVKSLVVFTGAVDFTGEVPAGLVGLGQLRAFLKKHAFGPCTIEDGDLVWQRLQEIAISGDAARRDFEAQIGFC